MEKLFDVIVIGAGPAGLSAGLYAGRSKLSVLILEKDAMGGQIVTTDEVANYPGAIEHETGPSLILRMVDQAKFFGAEIIKDSIKSVELTGDIKKVIGEKATYTGKTVIIATGGQPKLIGCPGEKELTGKGVSYCATCDADFFTDLEVFVVGGGDTAVEEAMYLTKFARKVTIVHRRDELRAAKSIVEKAKANPKMSFMWDSVIEEVKGDGVLEAATFKNVKTGEITEYLANDDDGTFGVFVFIGFDAVSAMYKGVIDMDHAGYIITNDDMHTNVKGVFAAGDIRVKSLRQVVTATADGAISAMQAEKYLAELEH